MAVAVKGGGGAEGSARWTKREGPLNDDDRSDEEWREQVPTYVYSGRYHYEDEWADGGRWWEFDNKKTKGDFSTNLADEVACFEPSRVRVGTER